MAAKANIFVLWKFCFLFVGIISQDTNTTLAPTTTPESIATTAAIPESTAIERNTGNILKCHFGHLSLFRLANLSNEIGARSLPSHNLSHYNDYFRLSLTFSASYTVFSGLDCIYTRNLRSQLAFE